jgi:uncharacterized protein YfaS (alpha-2-macroglobulin family)
LTNNIQIIIYYTNLALTHILPSGWEIFNLKLADNPAESESRLNRGQRGGITYQDIRDVRVLSYLDLSSSKIITVSILVQAGYIGRFFMPAVICQAIYDNTVYARTQGMWVDVAK